jgi:hypothetical protein
MADLIIPHLNPALAGTRKIGHVTAAKVSRWPTWDCDIVAPSSTVEGPDELAKGFDPILSQTQGAQGDYLPQM